MTIFSGYDNECVLIYYTFHDIPTQCYYLISLSGNTYDFWRWICQHRIQTTVFGEGLTRFVYVSQIYLVAVVKSKFYKYLNFLPFKSKFIFIETICIGLNDCQPHFIAQLQWYQDKVFLIERFDNGHTWHIGAVVLRFFWSSTRANRERIYKAF